MTTPTLDRPASRTAEMVLAYRAQAHERWPALCADGWAGRLATPEGHTLTEGFSAHFRDMCLWIGLRTAYIDACVARAVAEGWRQVVVLGAGFDTRAARLAAPALRFFEVDTPASQAAKRDRLASLGDYPGQPVMVACDFEHQRVDEVLQAAGFEAGQPSLLIWEGVNYYLPAPVVADALRSYAGLIRGGGELVFDVLRPGLAGGRGDASVAGSRELLSAVGEPVRSGLADPLPVLVEAGFGWVRTQTFEEVCLALTGSYDATRRFRHQSLCRARVVPPASRL